MRELFEEGTFPRELARELGQLGFLGMHLQGYGCAGASAVEYGLVCHELEAEDSGWRTFVSVPGLARDVARSPSTDSEEQKQQWLPPMAAWRGDRLLRVDRAAGRQRPGRHDPRPRDATEAAREPTG